MALPEGGKYRTLLFGSRLNDVAQSLLHPLPSPHTQLHEHRGFISRRYRLMEQKEKMKAPFADLCLQLWGLNRHESDEQKNTTERARRTLIDIFDAVPHSPLYTEGQKNTVQFLGFNSEEEFLNSMPTVYATQIANLLTDNAENEATIASFQKLCAFAQEGYRPLNKRKSGESAYCHAARVLYYTFDNIIHTGAKLSQEDVIDIASIALLHDADEDWGKEDRPLRKYEKESGNDNKSYTYELVNPGVSTWAHKLSARAHAGIQALTFSEVDTDTQKFHHVVEKSPWAAVELVKGMDRLDNMLTYGLSTKSWWHYIYKMYESAALLTDLSLTTRIAHAFDRNADISHSRPGEILAYGMLMHGLHTVREELVRNLTLQHVHVRRTFNLPDGVQTWDDPIFPDFRDTLNACRIRPFSPHITTGDLANYEAEVLACTAERVWHGNPVPGYGAQPFIRARTANDTKLDIVKNLALASQIAGITGTGVGISGALIAKQFPENPLGAMLFFATSLGIGVGIGGVIFDRTIEYLRRKQGPRIN